MLRLLAQLEPDNTAAQWYLWVSLIMLIGALVVLIPVVAGVGRRWKRRQLKAIEEDRAARRAGKTGERTDAWSASADRYVDHDKLPPEDELFDHGSDEDADDLDVENDDDDDDPPSDADEGGSPDEDERDPFGLFEDKPYRDTEDDDEDDFDEDDDWGADEDEEDEEDEPR